MAMHYYNADARRRIRNAVQWVEQQFEPRIVERQWNPPTVVDRLVFIDEDIDSGKQGKVTLMKGRAIYSGVTAWDGQELQQVFNPGPKVWAGTQAIVSRVSLAQADPGEAIKWYIVRAFSATRIRGKTNASIVAGGTGTINVRQAIDGELPAASIQAYLPTEFVEVQADRVVWAEIVFRPEGSRWEIYSADCDGQ